MIQGENNSNFICMQRIIGKMEKCNKTSSKISKHLVQQKVQQNLYNIHDVFFIRIFGFNLIVQRPPLKY